MDRERIEKHLEAKSTNKGKELKYKHIKRVAKKHNLSFEAVYNRAKELQGHGDLTIASNVRDKARSKGTLPPAMSFSETIKSIPSLNDFMKDAGVDRGDLNKPYNQEKLYKAIDKWGENTQLFETRSMKELTQRMDLSKKAQRTLDGYNSEYGNRIGKNGQLAFDKDGNRLKINEPQYMKINKMSDENRNKMKSARQDMKTFEQGGGFQPVNMTTKKKNKYTSKGKDLLKSIQI